MTNLTAKTFMHSMLLSIALLACTTTKQTPKADTSIDESVLLSQQNADAAIWYNTSAENYYLYRQTYAYATSMLAEKLTKLKPGMPPAVVLDIDETVLDNSPYMLELVQRGETYSEDTWDKWVSKANCNVLPGAKDFLRFCEENGVTVFYISNRSFKLLEPTMENMNRHQLPNVDPDHVLLKQDDSDKTVRRGQVTLENNVLLYIGDNLRDFDEIFKDRSSSYGKELVKERVSEMLTQYIILPNPMYGQWQSIFSFPKDAAPADKAKAKVKQAQPLDY